MKKFLSLIMVAAMLVAVLAMVGCGGNTETTTNKPAETTTEAPATTTTEEPATTTTEEPATTTTVKAPEATTTGTTLGIYDRFDWGTNTKAEAEEQTTHAWLVENLTYDKTRIDVSYTEDTIVIYAIKDYDSGAGRDAYALCFDNIVTFDFEDEFYPGWGTWNNAPMNPGTTWEGKYQYAKVRIKNSTANNIMSIHWHRSGEGFASTTSASCMYLQGGAPTSTSEHKLTSAIDEEWAVYYYDMRFLSSVGREINYTGKTSYFQVVSEAQSRGGYAQENWYGNVVTAMNFHVLGAYGKDKISDTRANIKMGDRVELDYVVFGSTIDQLKGWTSYLEDATK